MSSPLRNQKRTGEVVNYADGNSRIYFAVGKNEEASWPNLSWVARYFSGKKICFLHVIQPSRPTPSESASQDGENKCLQDILKKYRVMWRDVGLADGEEEVCIEMEKVEEGIVKLISELGIKNLVMRAAAREMESKISEYIVKNGAASCQIWFIHEGNLIKTRYEQVLIEVSSGSTNDTYEESLRCEKTAKESVEAARKAKAAEKMYTDEMHQRKEIEDALFVNKQELENMNDQLVAVTKERNRALWQKSLLEIKIADLETNADQYKEKLMSAIELLKSYKNQRDDLQLERDRALRVNEELSLQAASSWSIPQSIAEISKSDIEDATRGFHPSLKIGEVGNHKIYKGVLRGTEVAIKIFYADNSLGSSEYRQEVEVLSRLRHPNIVGLIGACPEAYAIVHEYLPNGSLEDRLSCKGKSSPLSWQARVRIASELCSALIFLHSTKPHCIVHGDLKPSNILLDVNFTSKLIDFGNCHVISPDPINSAGSAGSPRILPKGTLAYLDPDFRTAVEPEPTPQLDVYSFGIILLKLLTGREAWGIANEVQHAVRNGKLNSLLDSSAGDWPYPQTRQLTNIALRCADESRKNRPYLESEVLKILESIKASCLGIPLSPHLGVDRLSQAPSYYICPISQDIMQDPQVAADGFTYELESIQGWIRSGHNTSPMTNLKLAHTKLVPNRALRSAIQEWLQHN